MLVHFCTVEIIQQQIIKNNFKKSIMKKNILSLLFVFLTASVFAVNLSWNSLYLGYPNCKAVDIKKNANGIYVLMQIDYPGNSFNNGDSDRILILKYNFNGGLIGSCRYNYLLFAKQEPKNMLLDNSGNVYVLFTNTGTTFFTEYFVLKMNPNLSTQLGLFSPNLGSNQRKAGLMRFAENNTSIVISTYVNYPGNYGTELTKIDLNGNQLWNYAYVTGYYSRPFIYDFKIKKGRVICCGSKLKGTNTTARDIWVLSINATNGVFKFEHTYNSTYAQFYYASFIEGDNSKNIYIGGQSFQTVNKAVWFMAKLDSLGNEKWTKTYEPTQNYGGPLHAMAIDSKNKLYYFGIADLNGSKSRILKLDDAGNQVWAKIIKSNLTITEDPIDMKVSSTDKIYCATQISNGTQSTHLYQFDENGNKIDEDTSYFWPRKMELSDNNVLIIGLTYISPIYIPGIAVFNATPIRQSDCETSGLNVAEKTISFYPNPASTAINFEYDGDAQQIDISIYNTDGKLVKQSKTTSDKPLPVYDLPGGIYLINIASNHFKKSSKLIVKH